MRILMSRPSLGQLELQAVEAVFKSGWLGEGRITEDFEAAVKAYTGAPHVVAVNTGTSALHLTLASRGIGPGDEVILPAFTFAGDAMAVSLCGAKPVFADIDAQTLNLDPASVKTLVSSNTRAVMPTDYAGLPADMHGLREAVGRDDVIFVRDASHSFGSLSKGAPVGISDGEDATCFSFDPIKTLTCGEGGAILVNDSDWAEQLSVQRRLGFERSAWTGIHGKMVDDRRVTRVGYRYHMSNLNAAIGLAQFNRLASLVEGRRHVAHRYDEAFSGSRTVRCFQRDYDSLAPFIYPVLVDASVRDSLISELSDYGIHAGLRYLPCHMHPHFTSCRALDLAVTMRIAYELVCLPIYPDMTNNDIDEVVDRVTSFLVKPR